jgi:hypothetical protein
MSLEDVATFLTMRRTEERGRDILEIFAERQTCAHAMTAESESNLLQSIRRRKSADNAEQHKNRQCDPAKRAARAARKRELREEKLGRPARAYRKKAAA